MTGKFETADSLGGAFLVDEDTLRRLFANIIAAHPTSQSGVKVSVTFEETRTIETSVIDDVFTDPMLRSKRITDFSMRCVSADQLSKISIGNKSWKPVTYSISGDRNWALALEHQILNEILATARWWGYFRDNTKTREKLGRWIFALWVLTMTCIGIAAGLKWMVATKILLGVAVVLIFRFIVVVSINWLFPVVMFNFGWGARDFGARSNAFYIVTVGIILALAVGLLTGWIGKQLGL
ncbi:hypothetical protein G6M02_14070 [Agrobacterium rhizogenes]|nr:hypothetical protein [Rhizobium rhizogenes]